MLEPGGLLGEIAGRKRAEVAARLGGASLAGLRGQAEPTKRSLSAALAAPGARFIMEVKKSSPSGGPLRHGVDVAAQAAAYAGPAAAVSVLTDGPFFGGSLGDLAAVRRAFDGPVLAKDFIVDARQVAEARLHGADAILILLALLEDHEAAAVAGEAEALGMDALFEVRDENELRRALALGAGIVGINNRDLRTLEVDLAVTERLAPLVPPGRLVVAESGIRDRADVERLAPLVDAFLVGTALMRAERPSMAARALAFGRVKICGLGDVGDVGRSARSGAGHLGFVFVPETPRAVDARAAGPLTEEARRCGSASVGVFRNARLHEVVATARLLGLDAVQLHGAEDETYVRDLRRALGGDVEIWVASPVGTRAPPPRPEADRILFDTRIAARSGGTGTPFDWSLVRSRGELGSALLAGGIGPANVRRAARVGAWALDIGSAVEAAPGRKDSARLAALFEALRPASRSEGAAC